MKIASTLPIICFEVFLASATGAWAQEISPDGVWVEIDRVVDPTIASTMVDSSHAGAEPSRYVKARAYRLFDVDQQRLSKLLETAPQEFAEGAAPVVLAIPFPDGSYQRVRIEESSVFSSELQERHPNIRTYRAQGVDEPTLTGRLDHTPAGFHAMLIGSRGTVFVDPVVYGNPSEYTSYWRKDAVGEPFVCQTHPEEIIPEAGHLRSLFGDSSLASNPSGSQLRTYRLAISVTGEYTRFFDGTPATAGTPNTVNQIATTVNRVTGIYEREVQSRLQVVATRIFQDPATDPFSSRNFLAENQTELDTNVGNANYDVGHVFSQGGSGGVANLGVVCVNGSKARGFTSLANPSGDPFDVDFVAHEIGHQFAGNHTWTANTGSCSDAGQFVAPAAYEPGSGSTIMAYAGICGAQDVQANSDAYFHTHNYDEIVAFRTSGNGSTCGTATATGNNPPTVDAGPDCTVPRSTPFTLTANGSDPDGDPLTYLWEQFDLGSHGGAPQPTNTTGPMFRSRPGTASTSRTFPRFQDILSGAPIPFEVLPSVDRTLNFRVTARDNRASGGGVDYDSMVVNVSGSPFQFTVPSEVSVLECGASATTKWKVGGGRVAPNVGIDFSPNDGQDFAPLVGNARNDGSHPVTVPQILTTAGRMKLVPSADCFFAVSQKFSIADTLAPSLVPPQNIVQECTSPSGTLVNLGSPIVSDLCDSSLVVNNNAPNPPIFPLGTTVVQWTATDGSGNQATANQMVKIQDTTMQHGER